MKHVALVGDWHGNTRWAISVIERLAEAGVKTIYQLGDFGLWPGYEGEEYLRKIVGACEANGVTLWVTPGNHEDYTQIEDPAGPEVPERQILASGSDWEVAILPRGYVWEVGMTRFLSFGGAPSIDYQFRKPGRSWWPEEMIRDSDLERLNGVENIDVMLCHDSPDGGTDLVQTIIDTPPHLSGWSEQALEYCKIGRDKLNRAVEIVKPKLFAHGHYHVADGRWDEEKDCMYLSLDMDGLNKNVAVLDLEELTISWMK